MPNLVTKNVSPRYHDDVEYVLAKNRIIDMGGFIGTDTLFDLSKRLRYLSLQNKKPITIYLNTPGGSIVDGLGIYDLIRETARKVPINIVAIGSCMSMGTVILQAGSRRLSYPNTTFLLHELRGDNGGTLSQMRDTQHHVERLQRRLNDIYSKHTGMDRKKLEKLVMRKDTFIEASEALELNLIDEIVEV